MSHIPDTEQKLKAKISRYKSSMSKELKEHGCISDGYGKRFLLFSFYLVLGDNFKFSEYMAWYEKQFPDDGGEPVQLLCWTLGLYRMNRVAEAKHKLAELMFSNLYIVPKLLGEEIQILPIWHGSNYMEIDHCEEIPSEVLGTLSQEELSWLQTVYYSDAFSSARKRYIEIYAELDTVKDRDTRSTLVTESRHLQLELCKLKNGWGLE